MAAAFTAMSDILIRGAAEHSIQQRNHCQKAQSRFNQQAAWQLARTFDDEVLRLEDFEALVISPRESNLVEKVQPEALVENAIA